MSLMSLHEHVGHFPPRSTKPHQQRGGQHTHTHLRPLPSLHYVPFILLAGQPSCMLAGSPLQYVQRCDVPTWSFNMGKPKHLSHSPCIVNIRRVVGKCGCGAQLHETQNPACEARERQMPGGTSRAKYKFPAVQTCLARFIGAFPTPFPGFPAFSNG